MESSIQASQRILAAAMFAAEKHSAQRRKGESAEPYINHLIEVAHRVAEALPEADTNLLMAALLHDVIEDAGVSRQELEDRFGADVAGLVAEVTDDKSLPKAERKRLQVENAPKKSARAQAIKLADKTSNIQAILTSPPADWEQARCQEYFEWARRVVDRLSSPNPKLKAEFDKIHQQFGRAGLAAAE